MSGSVYGLFLRPRRYPSTPTPITGIAASTMMSSVLGALAPERSPDSSRVCSELERVQNSPPGLENTLFARSVPHFGLVESVYVGLAPTNDQSSQS